MKNITIAIDGFSGCGKSTLAKALAKRLDYIYVDTGAMYRSATLHFIRNGVDLADAEQVTQALHSINISFKNIDGKNTTFLNGENVESEIRGMEVTEMVSPVAAISAVRRVMVAQQQEMGEGGGLVMDGRDIGTVVFPDAELKIFVTADTEIRAKRRLDEMISKGLEADFRAIKKNLKERDRIDSTREDSPLKQAEDAKVIDTSDITKEQQLEMAVGFFQEAQEEIKKAEEGIFGTIRVVESKADNGGFAVQIQTERGSFLGNEVLVGEETGLEWKVAARITNSFSLPPLAGQNISHRMEKWGSLDEMKTRERETKRLETENIFTYRLEPLGHGNQPSQETTLILLDNKTKPV